MKFRMCDVCKPKLCRKCRDNVFFAGEEKIKNYKIRTKNKYNLHF